jgi:hypothetical protein
LIVNYIFLTFFLLHILISKHNCQYHNLKIRHLGHLISIHFIAPIILHLILWMPYELQIIIIVHLIYLLLFHEKQKIIIFYRFSLFISLLLHRLLLYFYLFEKVNFISLIIFNIFILLFIYYSYFYLLLIFYLTNYFAHHFFHFLYFERFFIIFAQLVYSLILIIMLISFYFREVFEVVLQHLVELIFVTFAIIFLCLNRSLFLVKVNPNSLP